MRSPVTSKSERRAKQLPRLPSSNENGAFPTSAATENIPSSIICSCRADRLRCGGVRPAAIHLQNIGDYRPPNGLADVIVHSRIKATFAVPFHRMSGHGDDGRVRSSARLLAANRSEE